MEMQRILENWDADGRPTMDDMRLRLIPKSQGRPELDYGKVYERRDNFLHVWMDRNAAP